MSFQGARLNVQRAPVGSHLTTWILRCRGGPFRMDHVRFLGRGRWSRPYADKGYEVRTRIR